VSSTGYDRYGNLLTINGTQGGSGCSQPTLSLAVNPRINIGQVTIKILFLRREHSVFPGCTAQAKTAYDDANFITSGLDRRVIYRPVGKYIAPPRKPKMRQKLQMRQKRKF
jgi:hypothetical protein